MAPSAIWADFRLFTDKRPAVVEAWGTTAERLRTVRGGLLGVSVSAVSQHLAKLRARGLVISRRDAQTIYYRLGEHDFIGRLREEHFGAWAH